ncbi:MAG: NADAR family protein [Planctomycetota bacterium]
MNEPTKTDPIGSFTEEHAFLSNFHYSVVHWDGREYPTVEHAFQAAKTSDEDERRLVREASSPAQAKKLGKKVTLRSDWETVKIDIMEQLVREKFTKHAALRAALLETGERELIEGNTWGDRFWGKVRGAGKNHLGKILMRVREELQGSA